MTINLKNFLNDKKKMSRMGKIQDLKQIDGFDVSFHERSKRIINIKIEDEIIERFIFPFKKFDITALEYKPFTRFTIAKSMNDSTSHELGKL